MSGPVFEVDQIIVYKNKELIGQTGKLYHGDVTIVLDQAYVCHNNVCTGCSGQALTLYGLDLKGKNPHWCSRSFRKAVVSDKNKIVELLERKK